MAFQQVISLEKITVQTAATVLFGAVSTVHMITRGGHETDGFADLGLCSNEMYLSLIFSSTLQVPRSKNCSSLKHLVWVPLVSLCLSRNLEMRRIRY